jgi:predicted Fe-Mo cluster-binding NifX family protein
MKIGFTAKGTHWDAEMDPRFGRAEYLLIYDEEKDELMSSDNSAMKEKAHGVGPGTASILFKLGAQVLITGNGPGENAAGILKKAGIEIYTGADGMKIEEAYTRYKNNELNEF